VKKASIFIQAYFNQLLQPILAIPRPAKRMVVGLVDFSLCLLTVWLAYYLRTGEFISLSGQLLWAVWGSVLIALPMFVIFGLYRAIFRYAGSHALLTIANACLVYGLLYFTLFGVYGVVGIPRTIGIIQPLLLLFFVGSSRVLARFWLGTQYQNILKKASRSKVLIYGAGNSGRQLLSALSNSSEMQVVGFLEDDDRLFGHDLHGQRIYSSKDLPGLVLELNISIVLLAFPNISRTRRNEILSNIRSARVAVRSLPSLPDLAQGVWSFSDLRELDVEDLLGRDPVTPNAILLSKNIRDKVVLVTGAGGSIGSELCRQVILSEPAKLLLVDQNEFALYSIHQEIENKIKDRSASVVPILASVQDFNRMNQVMSAWHPDTVYHAAAYKHVPLVEHNPSEGIKNNVFGTLHSARAAAENKVADFVLISTDKAVRPTNIMGASKRLAELILQAISLIYPKTRFSMVRFGNVLGSSGSVVPIFRQQIKGGGPITLTHPEVTRFFMTIPEAAQLVIQASAMAKGGDVFILDMGEPVKIIDLARRMIELSGYTVKDEEYPEGEIEIQITGLRPGEKLYEELIIGENLQVTNHPRIMKANESYMSWHQLESQLKSLEDALKIYDIQTIRVIFEKLVSGYTPSKSIVDWIFMEQEPEQDRIFDHQHLNNNHSEFNEEP
jgi:FlaA1/EpsC-like NDP-sugar epimerase